jgi:hypothetical protein
MKEIPIGLSKDAFKRTRATVIRVENEPYPRSQDQPPDLILWNPGVIEGFLTSSLPAFNTNTNTYGQGTFQPVYPSNSNSNSFVQTIDPNYSNSTIILNNSANSGVINSGVRCGAAWRNGVFVLSWADC